MHNVRKSIAVLAAGVLVVVTWSVWARPDDGRFQNLDAVIEHYDQQFNLSLSPQERKELVEFVKSL